MKRLFPALLFLAAIPLLTSWWALSLSTTARADEPNPRFNDLTAEWTFDHRTLIGPFHNLYNPCIVETPDAAYPFRMWFFGWPVTDPELDSPNVGDSILHARSKNLLDWEVYAGEAEDGTPQWDTTMQPEKWVRIMQPEAGARLDNAAVGDPSVVLKDGVFYMAYSSVTFESHAETTPQHLYNISCVMGAKSTDGIHWEKTEEPILIWDQEFVNRWDIAPDGTPPAPPDYFGAYHRPSLMWDEGRWKIWFDYMHPGQFVAGGYAENTSDFMDPKDWRVVKSGREPAIEDWPNTSVVRVNGRYLAFSDAPNFPAEFGGEGRNITVAESDDGIAWRILGHIRPEGMAVSHVPEAFLRREANGQWLYVFYAWKPERLPDAPWDYRYKEVRCMKRRIEEPDGQSKRQRPRPR